MQCYLSAFCIYKKLWKGKTETVTPLLKFHTENLPPNKPILMYLFINCASLTLKHKSVQELKLTGHSKAVSNEEKLARTHSLKHTHLGNFMLNLTKSLLFFPKLRMYWW